MECVQYCKNRKKKNTKLLFTLGIRIWDQLGTISSPPYLLYNRNDRIFSGLYCVLCPLVHFIIPLSFLPCNQMLFNISNINTDHATPEHQLHQAKSNEKWFAQNNLHSWRNVGPKVKSNGLWVFICTLCTEKFLLSFDSIHSIFRNWMSDRNRMRNNNNNGI